MNKIFLIVAFAAAVAAESACYVDFQFACKNAACIDAVTTVVDETSFMTTDCKAVITAGVDDCMVVQKCLDAEAAVEAEAKFQAFCPTDKAKCADLDAFCPTWAQQTVSECTTNPDWMLLNCQASCCPVCTDTNTLSAGVCPSTDRKDLCVTNSAVQGHTCEAWAAATTNECSKNKKWMTGNCMQSCCDTCFTDSMGCATTKRQCSNKFADPVDEDDINAIPLLADAIAVNNKQCADWAKVGECTANSKWMMMNCGAECCPLCVPKAPVKAPAPAPAPVISNFGSNFGQYGSFTGYGR